MENKVIVIERGTKRGICTSSLPKLPLTTKGAGPGRSQEPGTPSSSATWEEGIQVLQPSSAAS